ncbi:RING-H2 finger protein ATL8-like isoform X1 [Diospyros lotus]|uniref:RING-H2 finger protein ATL8-like isoform X1 n=1 Tax=Diospyros lotus TaxID=55363 RepID=UPI00224E0576|nr:RING-H2 finger protein ATL8-like isoform X1 [Diospyros lotus]
MMSSGINLVMTVIGFAVSTMFIVFVCTRLICARIQLNASRRSFPVSSRSDLSIRERGVNGLEPVVIANFPTKKYSDACFSSSEDVQCTVCLAEYHKEDTLRILPQCGHFFHVACIDKWLQQHPTCPVCRISLRVFSEKKHAQPPMFCAAIRSDHGAERVDANFCRCSSAGPALPARLHNCHGMEPVRENQSASERDGVGVGERVSILVEDSETTAKGAAGEKRVESPSNT